MDLKMEISKKSVFNVEYAPIFTEEKKAKIKWTSRIAEIVNKHKIVTLFILIFCTCCALNFILIYNFMQILEKL